MPDINSMFPSKLYKAVEIATPLTLTIRAVQVEELGTGKDKERKPVVYFREGDRGMALNKTNANTIAAVLGNDTDGWIGRPITLYAAQVEFQGRMTPGIRVRLSANGDGGAGPAGLPPAPAVKPIAGGSKGTAWSAYVAKLRAFEQQGGTPYSAEDRGSVFWELVAQVHRGVEDFSTLTALQWAKVTSAMADFDAADRSLPPI